MDLSQEDGTPKATRLATGGGGSGATSDSGHESLSSRESLKSISKSIVLQRTQMFEQGTTDIISDASSVTGSGSGSENGDSGQGKDVDSSSRNKQSSPSCESVTSHREHPIPAERPVPAERQVLSDQLVSPKKVVSNTVEITKPSDIRQSPKTSPTHCLGRTRRTHSPRRASPSHSPKPSCQPKIILGVAPRTAEAPATPVKPPRSKKPAAKLKLQGASSSSPNSPHVKPRVSRSESMTEREKPTPVRKAPGVPGPRPQSMSRADNSEHITQASIIDENTIIDALRKQSLLQERNPLEKNVTESSQPTKGAKPTVPLKPSDLFKDKSPRCTRQTNKPEILKEKPSNKPEVVAEKPPLTGESTEWIKRRYEVMRNRALSETNEEGEVVACDTDYKSETLPRYALVDKPRKKPRPKSGEVLIRNTDGSHAFDGVKILESAGEIQVDKPPPPLKPPRTFAHDAYVKKKQERREKRRSQSATQSQCEQIIANGNHDKGKAENTDDLNGSITFNAPRVEPYAISISSKPSGTRLQHSESMYEEIRENRPRKPPPPPRPKAPQRPPAPGVLRVRQDQSAVVRVVKHNTQIPEEGFIKSGHRKISNPNYELHHDIIPIKTYRDQALKRHKSDEYLYADPQAVISHDMARPGSVSPVDNPIYQDPADVTNPRSRSCITSHGVSLDEEGYAIPDMQRHTMGRRQKFRSPSFNIKHVPKWGTREKPKLAKFTNNDFRASIARKKLPSVREKVSRAYSILRRQAPVSPDGQPTMEPSPEEDEDSQVDIEEHQRRLAHVSSTKDKHYATLDYTRVNITRPQPHLFDYAMVVGLEKDPETTKYKPHIMYKYPDLLPSSIETIAEFCFPDAEQWRPVTQAQTEDFFFVLTSADGARHYGYCRRLLPPGNQNRLPEVYCCVSALGATGFYQQLLNELDKLRQLSPDLPYHLIKAAYAHPIPPPGRETWISCPVNDGKKETVILKRSVDSRLEKVSFEALFKYLNVDTILKIFGSVLLERRVLFTAQHLSTLSSCISALTVILYPFTWQHTFVPVLPTSMIDVCCAPTPYILGILSTSLPNVQALELEEVLIVDLDTNSLLASLGDEHTILPRKLQKCLRTALHEDSDLAGIARDTVIFEAFLRMFVETTGHYTEFMNTQQDGELVFQKEQFTKAVSSKSIRLFLEWFVETQMFEVFITDHLQDDSPASGLFETRIEEYRDEMDQMSLSLKDNVKQIGRKMISFVSEAGGKLKKAFGGEKNVYV